jgi:hypothetical protein
VVLVATFVERYSSYTFLFGSLGYQSADLFGCLNISAVIYLALQYRI